MTGEQQCNEEREELFKAYARFETLHRLFFELDERAGNLIAEAEAAIAAGDEDRSHRLWAEAVANIQAAQEIFTLADEARAAMDEIWHGYLACRHEQEAAEVPS
ncbi:MAG: hypothetical protein AAF799_48515 [Myxococcota bacterium]